MKNDSQNFLAFEFSKHLMISFKFLVAGTYSLHNWPEFQGTHLPITCVRLQNIELNFIPNNAIFKDLCDSVSEVRSVLRSPRNLLPVNVDRSLSKSVRHYFETSQVRVRTKVRYSGQGSSFGNRWLRPQTSVCSVGLKIIC
jgi:hypothetical protein